MFKKIASSVFGLSKLGVFISNEQFDKTEVNNYILDSIEDIYYVIRTKTDEYCFTNRAFIHVDGTSSENNRSVLNRYDYSSYVFDNVFLETAGAIDIDAEIKITLKPTSEYRRKEPLKHPPLKLAIVKDPSVVEFSIDVHRKYSSELKALYKALISISQEQKQNIQKLELSENTLNRSFGSLVAGKDNQTSLSNVFEEITNFADDWMLNKKEEYSNEDFRTIFERGYKK